MFCFVLTNLFLIVTVCNSASPGTEQEEKLVTLSLQKDVLAANENHDNLDGNNPGSNLGCEINHLDRTFEEKVMEEFDKMESIFRETFKKEEDKFYRLMASDVPNDNRFHHLKVDLQRDIDQLKAQLESQVEEGPRGVASKEEEVETETSIFGDNYHSREKRHNSKKKSTPCQSNLCSFTFRSQYGGLNKDTKVNNQPPTSCADLGRRGYTMSALYPVKEDARSEKISIVHCEFNSPIDENEYEHKTIGGNIEIDLSHCIEAEKAEESPKKEEKSSHEPKAPQRHQNENHQDMQYQPEQEVQEAAPAQKENIFTQTLQGAGKVLNSVGSMFTNLFQG